MHHLRGPVLVTGATGQVGGSLVELLADEVGVLAPSRTELDLSSPEQIARFIAENKPAWIVNAGAYTAVDAAESDPEVAHAVNALAPAAMGRAAALTGTPILHYSTDYVYDGDGTHARREEDPTCPLNIYGATKLEGEQALAASNAPFAVFRTSWVYGATGKNFLLTILRLAREQKQIKIVADQYGAPTSAKSLAQLAVHTMSVANATGDPTTAMRARLGGTYHACNAGVTSWFGFAEEFLRIASQVETDVDFARLLPIRSTDFPSVAKRPFNSRLNCDRLGFRLGFHMPEWQDAMSEVMSEYYRRREMRRCAEYLWS